MNFDKKQLRNTLLLLLGALIWGTAFVAQSVGSGYVGPYTFLAARSWLACAFLIVLVLLRRGKARKADPGVPFWINGRMLLRGGAFCGIALFAASAAQQIGIGTTSTAKAGFLTALYVVLVPLLGVFFGRRPGVKLGICACISLAGLYLLCLAGHDTLTLTGGEWMLLLCSLLCLYVLHVLERTVVETNTALTAYVQKSVDTRLEELHRYSTTIEITHANTLLKNLRELPGTLPAQAYQLSVTLRDFLVTNKLARGVYLYYPRTGLVVGNMGCFEAASYYALQGVPQREGYDAWLAELTKSHDTRFMLLQMPKDERLCYVREMRMTGEIAAVVVIEIDREELLRKLVPKQLVFPLAHELDIHSKSYVSKLTEEQITRLIRTLKGLTFPIADYAPFEYAVTTAGGVRCDEVNPHTMESLKVRGLYFAGEVLDLDANTGGYNLQIAFSTGRLAGMLKK